MATRYRFASRRRRPKPSRYMGAGILPMGRSDQPQGIPQAVAQQQPGVVATAAGQEGFAEMVTGLAQAQGERQEAEIERRAQAMENKLNREARITEMERREELVAEREGRRTDPVVGTIISRLVQEEGLTPETVGAWSEYRRAKERPAEERPPGFVGPPQPSPEETFAERVTRTGRPRATGSLDELEQVQYFPENFQFNAADKEQGLDPGFLVWLDAAIRKHTPDQIAGAAASRYRQQLVDRRYGWGPLGRLVGKPVSRGLEGWHINRRVDQFRQEVRKLAFAKIDGKPQ